MYMPIDSNLADELINIAEARSYTHVVHLIKLFSLSEAPTLSEFDKKHISLFLSSIKSDTALKYPFWDDDLDNYVESDGDEFLEVMNDLYGHFSTWLLDELNITVE